MINKEFEGMEVYFNNCIRIKKGALTLDIEILE